MQPNEREKRNYNELPTSLDADDDFDITAVLEQEDGSTPTAPAIAAIKPAIKTAARAPAKKSLQAAAAQPEGSARVRGAATSTATSVATINPGQVLKNRFVLEELLDRGGIGVVYKARDLLRQSAAAGSDRIALKVLREDFRGEPQLLKSLQREALQSQGLSHPNIVRVYDFHQDGETPFLTMELLDGELLRTTLAKYRPSTMPRARALRIVAGMCSGLAHAHAHGIVHGDFKPGNVFLTARDEAKILDFGLADAAPAAGGQAGNA
ncbi:MAG: serine/threonine protein kinase, partial [Gammaproteobacteria bacterium]|nr:serine/threonine protein kinase [Gammaproteobacteria bacterium]